MFLTMACRFLFIPTFGSHENFVEESINFSAQTLAALNKKQN